MNTVGVFPGTDVEGFMVGIEGRSGWRTWKCVVGGFSEKEERSRTKCH